MLNSRQLLGSRRLWVVKEAGTQHEERAWTGRLPRALRFLYGALGTH